MTREAIFPPDRHSLYSKHRYSAAVRSGDLLFVSGQVGSRSDGSPEPDFERQVALASDNRAALLRAAGGTAGEGSARAAAVLSAAGCGLEDVVDATTFHTDPANQLETILKVRDRVIGEPPYPNWTAVGVTWLAGFDFEIKVIARIPRAA